MTANTPKAICIFGDYDPHHYRYTILKRGMQAYGIKVLECNCNLRFNNFLVRRKVSRALWYILKGYLKLIRKLWPMRNDFSHFFLPSDHLNAPLAWVLAKLFNKKMIFDIYDPLYEFAKLNNYTKWQLWVRYYLEKITLHMADHLLVYTAETRNLIQQDYSLSSDRFSVFPVGADTGIFYPSNDQNDEAGSPFKVVFWGGLYLHHGVKIIIRAIELLKEHKDIQFYFAGGSRLYKSNHEILLKNLVEQERSNNLILTGFLTREELINLIRQSSVCLGIFSAEPLALATVPCKVFEALAMRKPVITVNSPAVAAWFTHKEHLYMVSPENPDELAQAILELKGNPQLRNNLAAKGYAKFKNDFNETAICKPLKDLFNNYEVL